MPQESLPSKNTALLDVPEVHQFKTEFQYFYWTADEYENGLGSSEAALKQLPSETFDASYVAKTRRLPRLIKLDWKPVLIKERISVFGNDIKIKDHLAKLHSEETFTSNDFTSFVFQDSGLDMRLKFFVDNFINLLPEPIPATSTNELVNVVNNNTPEQVTPKFLFDVLSNLRRQGVKYHETGAVQETLSRLKNLVLSSRMNNKILMSILRTIKNDSLGLYSDEFSSGELTSNLQTIQNTAIANSNNSLLSPFDYDFEILSYVGYKPIDTNGYQSNVTTLGYQIDKKEIRADGTELQYPPILIENAAIGTTYDGQIKYGTTYAYRIRAIYLLEVRAIDDVTKQNLLVSFLVGSKFSSEQKVMTIETTPPPPPADFNLGWDYGLQALRCSWNLPTNPQQDIKFIQLFRRKSIADPFQLIKMWDFNDTNTRVSLNEFPSPELVVKSKSFVGSYIDHEFGKDSNYIYTVACIDAHGYFSNYSLQLEASFDRYQNRLIKKLISISGAPKQYPNAYLNGDTFVDTIKDSGHNKLRIVFNPEYLEVRNSDNSNLELLKTDRNKGKYRLQIINVDLQAQQNVDVVLKDSRLTTGNRNSG
jgi:hypothetical protein